MRTRTVFPEGNASSTSTMRTTRPRARGNLLQVERLAQARIERAAARDDVHVQDSLPADRHRHRPARKVTEFFYDAANNLQRIQFPTVPEGTPQQLFSVNGLGQVETMTDENGHVTRFVYDANGYLDQVTRAYGTPRAATTELDPDAVGRPTVRARPAREHDRTGLQRLGQARDERRAAPFGYVTQMHYDADGTSRRSIASRSWPGTRRPRASPTRSSTRSRRSPTSSARPRRSATTPTTMARSSAIPS